LKAMDKLVPGIFSKQDTLLYGVEAKFYSSRVELNSNCETTVKNLFAIGDGAGITRGLSQAAASGLYVGQVVSERLRT
ncbi:MAG: FAD-dependent oxidoreductase, partial [Thermoproteota archaeon]